MTLTDLTPRPDQRGVIIGLSGSGKSHLGRAMLNNIVGPILIVDPKREVELNGYGYSNKAVWRQNRYVYQPSPGNLDNSKLYDSLFKQAYDRGKCTVLITELAVFTTGLRYPPYLKALYQQGRARGIRVIAETQRPSAIPPFVLSEAIRFYAFRLLVPDDIKKVRAMVPGYDPTNLPRYGFYYFDCLSPEGTSQIVKLG